MHEVDLYTSKYGNSLTEICCKKLLQCFYEVYSNIFVVVLLSREIQPHNYFYKSKARGRKSGQKTDASFERN